MQIHFQKSTYRLDYECYIDHFNEREKKLLVARPLEFVEVKEDSYLMYAQLKPTFHIDRRESDDFFQHLMDRLWAMGVRPAGVKDPSAQIEAMNKHLQDMRRLVFYPNGLKGERPHG